ncbi:hypothetical protein TCAL_01109 [Tigriopus californicus]|uniref:C2H2-type domain-containing protein n=1 Tax=Tigriopus californicus TaxID=6832 RepID=A0A553P345_TIGCA|nr:putative uncharacterized protein DDB_G0277255 [Tigriopus californicus]XP_059086519.1 putative uncharacterized protein DDB_G0277255 [Tigriopus californicus]XP_059086520.1 putative uncharacterized protein DDB_G0277255 [Tigriopus californicus]TRY72103.1 hypothetical protein TCAL_01109 [Tigriopus californicus]
MNHGSCAGGANSGAESNRSFGDTSSLLSSASYSSSSLHPGSKYPQYLARGRENIHGRGSYGSGRNSLGRPGHNQTNWMGGSHQSLYINPKSEEQVNNGTTTTTTSNNNNNHHGSNMRIAQVPRKSNQDPSDSGVLSNTPIRCEVCAVSVNSSNQLQAHLTGQKHRVRAVRRGLKTSQAKASPSSSTLTSSGSESEAGGGYNHRTRRLSSDIHQMKAPSGHSTRHRSLTFGGVRSGLSRHLSSSCLSNTRNSHPSRPYFSLRKAFSQITLSKSRSLSLLLQDSRRDQDSSWSYESQEESSLSEEDDYEREERQHDIRVQEESEGEELNPIEPSIALAPKDLSSDEGACQVDPKWIIKGEPRLKDSEILDNPEYQKLTQKQSSKKGTLLRKGSSKIINNNNNNNSNNSDGRQKNTCFVAAKSSLREIPMLNMFLQRLHSPQTRGTYTAHSSPSHMRNANLLSSKLAGRSGNFSMKKLNLTSPDTVLKEHTSLESDGMEASQS